MAAKKFNVDKHTWKSNNPNFIYRMITLELTNGNRKILEKRKYQFSDPSWRMKWTFLFFQCISKTLVLPLLKECIEPLSSPPKRMQKTWGGYRGDLHGYSEGQNAVLMWNTKKRFELFCIEMR